MVTITKITLVRTTGADKLYLHTNSLTPAIWPFKESPSFTLEVAGGFAEEWVETNFPKEIPFEKIVVKS